MAIKLVAVAYRGTYL